MRRAELTIISSSILLLISIAPHAQALSQGMALIRGSSTQTLRLWPKIARIATRSISMLSGSTRHKANARQETLSHPKQRGLAASLCASSSVTLDRSDDVAVPIPLKKLSDPHPIKLVLKDLLSMTRPITIPGEIGLAFGGSLIAAHSLSCFTLPTVWLVAMFSAITGMGSMVINDYFDFRAGVDYLKPKKPLTRGTVHPEQALLAAMFFYMSALFLAAILLTDAVLRALVATSLMATFLYTPLLKRIPLVKNTVVAFVISQAIIAGGIATGHPAHLSRTLLPCLYVFCTIMWQELLMDINDQLGDLRGGILTLPVTLGKDMSMLIALFFVVCGATIPLLYTLLPLLPNSLHMSALMHASISTKCAIALPLAQLPLILGTVDVWKRGMIHMQIEKLLNWCFPVIALGLTVMAFL